MFKGYKERGEFNQKGIGHDYQSQVPGTKVDQVLPCIHLRISQISKTIVNFRKNGSVFMKNKTTVSALLKARKTLTSLKYLACAQPNLMNTLCDLSGTLYFQH